MKRSHYCLLRSLLVGMLVLFISALPAPAHAQEQSLYWERFDVELDVREDGTFRVTEDNYVNFTSGTFRYGFREIADERTTGIRDFEVVVDGQRLEQTDGLDEPGTFYTYPGVDGIGVRYYFSEPTSGQHHIALSYTVDGGLRHYEGGDQLWWDAVYSDRPATVAESTVRVSLPAAIPPDQIVTAAYDTDAESDVSSDGRTVTFAATEPIPPGDALEIRVQFPDGIVSGGAPPWQEASDQNQRATSIANVLVPALSLILLVGGLLGVFMLWYTRGRDKSVELTADYLSEPPGDLTPGLVGTLLDERADLKDVMATLLDLARKGAIRINETSPASSALFFQKGPEFAYELLDKSKATTEAERVLIREFFGNKSRRDLEDLKQKFYKSLPEVQEALYQEVIERGLFSEHPNKVRNRYTFSGIALFFLSIFLGVAGGSIFAAALGTPVVLCLPAALALVGGALLVVGQAMPRKTPAGGEAASKWQAFRRYLQQIDRFDDLEEKREIWDQYLPYA
ncbi:MAG: DUF2207 family protein, partial [Ardenticatenaceae bacterium]